MGSDNEESRKAAFLRLDLDLSVLILAVVLTLDFIISVWDCYASGFNEGVLRNQPASGKTNFLLGIVDFAFSRGLCRCNICCYDSLICASSWNSPRRLRKALDGNPLELIVTSVTLSGLTR
jgi:hypothetical protein